MANWLSNIWGFIKNPLRQIGKWTRSKANGDLSSLSNKIFGTHLTGAEQEANAFSASEAQKQRDFEQQMSDTSYQRQVADMQAAGVNPALAMGGSASGASTPSGASASSVSPESGSSLGEILQLLSFRKDMDIKEAQINNLNADSHQKESGALKNEAETNLLGEDFKLRVRSADREDLKYFLSEKEYDLKKNLNEVEIDKIRKEMDSLEAGIREKNQNINESVARTANYMSLEVLHRAEAHQIVSLLPYSAALMSAQTQEARANAAWLGVQTAFKQGLIDRGYIDTMVDKAFAEVISENERANSLHLANETGTLKFIKEQIKTNIYSGHAFDYDLESARNGKFGDVWNKVFSDFLAGCAQFLDNFNPIAGLLGKE